MNTALKLAIAALALTASSTSGFTKDWIETVQLTKNGIDAVPISVNANAGGYTNIATSNHKFLLNLHAKATSGERIVAMKVGSTTPVRYFEADGNAWSKRFANRAVGSGTKRTVSIDFAPVIALTKINWQGANPKQACQQNMQAQMGKGWSKSQVLAKEWTVSSRAYFELDAVAAKKNKAKNNKWNIGNTTNQRDGMAYTLSATCKKGINKLPLQVKTN